METFIEFFEYLMGQFSPAILVPLVLLIIVGVIAQWSLYEKCGLRGIACIIPVWNVIEFLKIMGRPAHHIFYFLIPVYNIYFTIKVYIELCQCFGKHKLVDYVLVIVFNGFYVLYLGLSYGTNYKGPVYNTENTASTARLANMSRAF